MTIAAGFYSSAEGRKAENEITIATLRAFQELGINNAVLPEQIQVPGLTSGQVSGVVTALHEQNILTAGSVKRGYFSVQAFRISEAGEQILLKADGVSQVDADKAAILKILKNAAEEEGPCILNMPDIQQDRVERLVSGMKQEGLLDRASVKRGFFDIEGVQITQHGKQTLLSYDQKVTPKPSDINL